MNGRGSGGRETLAPFLSLPLSFEAVVARKVLLKHPPPFLWAVPRFFLFLPQTKPHTFFVLCLRSRLGRAGERKAKTLCAREPSYSLPLHLSFPPPCSCLARNHLFSPHREFSLYGPLICVAFSSEIPLENFAQRALHTLPCSALKVSEGPSSSSFYKKGVSLSWHSCLCTYGCFFAPLLLQLSLLFVPPSLPGEETKAAAAAGWKRWPWRRSGWYKK